MDRSVACLEEAGRYIAMSLFITANIDIQGGRPLVSKSIMDTLLAHELLRHPDAAPIKTVFLFCHYATAESIPSSAFFVPGRDGYSRPLLPNIRCCHRIFIDRHNLHVVDMLFLKNTGKLAWFCSPAEAPKKDPSC
jgi:hypothetical protein